jgi:L-fuconolactonase
MTSGRSACFPRTHRCPPRDVDLMLVDAHHHVWDPAAADYPWITEDLAIRHRFAPSDLAPHLSDAGVDATVLVQTRSSVEETRDFLAIAARTAFIRGVIGWVGRNGEDADRRAH